MSNRQLRSLLALQSWHIRAAQEHERREAKRRHIELLGGKMCWNCESAIAPDDAVCPGCWARQKD